MAHADVIHIDEGFVSRLLLGALSEHEQRKLAIRLLDVDLAFRVNVFSIVRPFEMFDLDLMAEYAAVLERHGGDPSYDLDARRDAIFQRALRRAPDLGMLIHEFTVTDLFNLGDVTRKLFSWSMAERLMAPAEGDRRSKYSVSTGLYLALMVIDVVEILGVTGHSPHYPGVIANVRQRIRARQR